MAVTLEDDFSVCERGNVWITSDGDHNAWLKLDNSNNWLEVSVRPSNYPGFNVSVINITEEDLMTHIRNTCKGMYIRKLNIDGEGAEECRAKGRIICLDEHEDDDECEDVEYTDEDCGI